MSKKGRRSNKLMPIAIEDDIYSEELQVVDAFRQAIILEELLPSTQDNPHMSWQKPKETIPKASISSSEYISLMKRLAKLDDTVAALSTKKPDAQSEKEKVLANALTHIEELKQELASTKKIFCSR